MIALISPAKNMRRGATSPIHIDSEPRFMELTLDIASQMVQYSAVEIMEIFKVSAPIARTLKERFVKIVDPTAQSPLPAVESYDGVVYKHFKSEEGFSSEEQQYLQSHLRISSLLYGLLRPMDRIMPYRMEGFVHLAESDIRVDKFWRKHQTQLLIDEVSKAGGELIYLASKEEQNSFDWRMVRKALRVIDIQFLQYKGEKLRQVVVYTKMARGEMVRYMLDNKITDPELLKEFEWSGYRYAPDHSTTDTWVWIME